MKLLGLRKLSLVMAILFVLTSFVCPVFATGTDKVLIDGLGTLGFMNFSTSDSTDAVPITRKGGYDIVADKNVMSHSSTSFGGFGSFNQAGKEVRYYLAGAATSGPVALYNDNEHDYLKFEFDVFIENNTDGIGIRTARYTFAEGSEDALDTTNQYYFGIGGSGFAANSVTTGYTYVSKALTVGKWHKVVMQIGASKNEHSVKFYVDNNEVTDITRETKGTPTVTIADGDDLPANTFGFGTTQNGFRCVLLPKGTLRAAFGLKIADFKVTATNNAYDTTATFKALNTPVIEITADTTLENATNNDLKFTSIQAPDINSTDLTKNVINIKTDTNGYAKGSDYTQNNYTNSDKQPKYLLLSAKNNPICDADLTKHDYLRLHFNVYIKDASNGVYFRTQRYSGSAWGSPDYVIGVGGSSFNNIASSDTVVTYTYKKLELNRWHNVVMELGTKAYDTTLKLYVDGEDVTPNATSDKFGKDAYYSFGGNSTNRCVLVPKANFGATMDMYLSDVVISASNAKYEDANPPVPFVYANTNNAGTAEGTIYAMPNVTMAEFEKVNAAYADVVTNSEGNAEYVVAYNDYSKLIKYYDIVSESGLYAGNIKLATNDDGKKIASAEVYNLTGEKKAVNVFFVSYNGDGTLAGVQVGAITDENDLQVRYYREREVSIPQGGYLKTFVWDGVNFAPLIAPKDLIAE